MNRNLKNLFNNQDTQTTVSSVSNNLSTFTSTPKVTNLHEFKRGAFVLSDQLNANFEALNSKLGEIVESYNSMSGLIATADVAKQIVLGGTLTPDLREDWPIVHLITITRPVIESDVLESSSQRQNLTASLNFANTGINMASSDSLDILVNVPANFTGNIFDKDAIANFEGGVATADVRSVIIGTDANLRFWYTYDYNTATQEQTYKFYATPNYLYSAVYTDDEEKWGTPIEGIQPEDDYTIQTLKLNQITVYAGFFEAENLIFQFEGQLQAESSINTLLQTEWTTTGVDTIFSDETELIGIYAETWDLTGIIDDVNTFIEEATNVIEGFDEAKLNAFDGSNNLAPTFFDVVDTVIRPINFFNEELFNNGNAVAAINSLNATNTAQTVRLNNLDNEQDTQDNLIGLNSSNILAITELIAAQTSGTFHGLNEGGTVEEGNWAVVKFTERQNTFKSIKYNATTGVFTLEEDFEILNVELLGQADNTGVSKDVTIRLMNHSDNTQVGASQKETIGKFGKVIFNSTVDLPAGEYRLEITSSVGGGDISFTQGQISLIKYAGNINAAISSNIVNDKALNPTAGINGDLNKIDDKLDTIKTENEVTTKFLHNTEDESIGMQITKGDEITSFSVARDGNVSTTVIDISAETLTIPEPTENKHWVNKKYVDEQLGAISTDTASITLTDPTTEGPTGAETTQADVNKLIKLIYNQIEID